MFDSETVRKRIEEMEKNPPPKIKWDEPCEGSGRSLVIFVGPSPGGERATGTREMEKNKFSPLWGKAYTDPLCWSRGFKVSFKPLVEAFFGAEYEKAGKLIGRANLDWHGEPESKNVPLHRMCEGFPSTLKMIEVCEAQILLAMDWKAFRVLHEMLGKSNGSYRVSEKKKIEKVVRIPGKSERSHRSIHVFVATDKKERRILVMKLLQHPARMYSEEYGKLSGEALRRAAEKLRDEKYW